MRNKCIHFIISSLFFIFYSDWLQIQPLFDSSEAKNKLLRTVAGGGVTQIADLQSKWDRFELMMQSFQLMVKEQVP